MRRACRSIRCLVARRSLSHLALAPSHPRRRDPRCHPTNPHRYEEVCTNMSRAVDEDDGLQDEHAIPLSPSTIEAKGNKRKREPARRGEDDIVGDEDDRGAARTSLDRNDTTKRTRGVDSTRQSSRPITAPFHDHFKATTPSTSKQPAKQGAPPTTSGSGKAMSVNAALHAIEAAFGVASPSGGGRGSSSSSGVAKRMSREQGQSWWLPACFIRP